MLADKMKKLFAGTDSDPLESIESDEEDMINTPSVFFTSLAPPGQLGSFS